MRKIAILDDYQGVALKSADWSPVLAGAEIVVFRDHLESDDALVERLRPFDAICVMRERTPLTAGILERLPNLKFIGSNAPYNASIDLDAARRRGVVVSGTGGRGNGAPELTWALILAAARHIPAEHASIRSGGMASRCGRRYGRQHARPPRARENRSTRCFGRARLRDEGHGMEPKPYRRNCRRGRRKTGRQDHATTGVGLAFSSSGSVRSHQRHHWGTRTCADESKRLVGKHIQRLTS